MKENVELQKQLIWDFGCPSNFNWLPKYRVYKLLMMKHKSVDQRVQIEEQNKIDHLLHVKIDVINWKLFQIVSSIACERWGGKECRAGVEQRNELVKKSFDFYAIQLSYFMKIDDGFIKKLLVISCWRWGERLERCNGGSFTLSFFISGTNAIWTHILSYKPFNFYNTLDKNFKTKLGSTSSIFLYFRILSHPLVKNGFGLTPIQKALQKGEIIKPY